MIDLITVVFRDEIPLLRIQAESINQYFDSKDMKQIEKELEKEPDKVERIMSVQFYGYHQVWDIQVEEDHSYCCAHGFINHNSNPNHQQTASNIVNVLNNLLPGLENLL